MPTRKAIFAAALAAALSVPGVAAGQGVGTPELDAEFKPGNLPADELSKRGKLFTRLATPGAEPPPPTTVALDYDRDIEFESRGLETCGPGAVIGRTSRLARKACKGSVLGKGKLTLVVAGRTDTGKLIAFNGPGSQGAGTILLHTFAAGFPIVFEGNLVRSPLGAPYGMRLEVPVSRAAGGPAPPGIAITHLSATLKRRYQHEKKARRARRLKRRAKRASGRRARRLLRRSKRIRSRSKLSYVAARCPDGTLRYRAAFEHSTGPRETVDAEQSCEARG